MMGKQKNVHPSEALSPTRQSFGDGAAKEGDLRFEI